MFRTREQLLEWLEHNPPTKIVGKAILEGEAELCGLFADLVGNQPGWVVHVTSPRGRKWDVAVLYDRYRRPHSGLLSKINWGKWIGCGYISDLCIGDNPGVYAERKANNDL